MLRLRWFLAAVLAPCLACSGGQGGIDAGPPLNCGPGTHLSGAFCVPDPIDAAPMLTCGDATRMLDGSCVADPPDAGAAPDPDAGFTDPTTWEANQAIGAVGSIAGGDPQLAVDSTGTIYLAGMDVTSPGHGCCVYLLRSAASPRSFVMVDRADSPGPSFTLGAPTVAVDRTDRVYFGWVRYASLSQGRYIGTLMVAQSADGTTFAAPQVVGPQDSTYPSDERPWLSLAPDGSMDLSWSYRSPNFAHPGVGAQHAGSQSGQPFGAPQTIFAPGASVLMLARTALGFDATGSPIEVSAPYTSDALGSMSYSIVAYRSEAANWTNANVATLIAERHFDFDAAPALASDSHGVLTAVFLNGISRDVQLYAARSTDGARTWSAPTLVENDMMPSHTFALPWVTVDESDRVHAMWLDNRYGNWVPYTASSADGVTFQTPERIGDATFVEDGSPTRWIGDSLSLVVRGHRRYAAWTDTRSGTSRVFFSTSPAP